MPELSTVTLPLLPLTSGVVLPGMVVTATLETPESRSASSAAGDTGGHLLLVPQGDGRYSSGGAAWPCPPPGSPPARGRRPAPPATPAATCCWSPRSTAAIPPSAPSPRSR